MIRTGKRDDDKKRKVLHLRGIIKPTEQAQISATARNISLPNGYDLTEKYDGFRDLDESRSLTRANVETNNYKNLDIPDVNFDSNSHDTATSDASDGLVNSDDINHLTTDEKTWLVYKQTGKVVLSPGDSYTIPFLTIN